MFSREFWNSSKNFHFNRSSIIWQLWWRLKMVSISPHFFTEKTSTKQIFNTPFWLCKVCFWRDGMVWYFFAWIFLGTLDFYSYIEWSHVRLAWRAKSSKSFFRISKVPMGIGMPLNKHTKMNRNIKWHEQKKIDARGSLETVLGKSVHSFT